MSYFRALQQIRGGFGQGAFPPANLDIQYKPLRTGYKAHSVQTMLAGKHSLQYSENSTLFSIVKLSFCIPNPDTLPKGWNRYKVNCRAATLKQIR